MRSLHDINTDFKRQQDRMTTIMPTVATAHIMELSSMLGLLNEKLEHLMPAVNPGMTKGK
jgi:hypothetical protein